MRNKRMIRKASNLFEQWVRKKTGLNRIYAIRYTTTWRCNSKCKSCYIWGIPKTDKKELSIEELDTFTSSPSLKYVRRVVFSGGEPTMRDDLPEVFRIFHKNIPGAYFAITLNGLTPNRTAGMIREILSSNPGIRILNVGLSINSSDPEVHDETRGVKGAFKKTMRTYYMIKDLVPTRFSFTFLPENINDFTATQDFALKHGTTAYLCWTVFSDRFNSKSLEGFNMDNPVIVDQLEAYCKKRRVDSLRRYDLLSAYLYSSFLNKKPVECYAGRQFFHLDPYGEVYPCNFISFIKENSFGNIRGVEFEDLWLNRDKRILRDIDNLKHQYTKYGVCGDSDLSYSVSANIPSVLKWYFLRKLRGKKYLIKDD